MDELAWQPGVEASHVAVAAADGVVTLTGYVDSLAQRWEAEKAAKRVLGVRAVVNDIEVRLDDADRRSDVDIAADAVDALRWNLLVPSRRIKVTVDHGRVKLEGEVKWRFQRDAAEETVRKIRGVIEVINLIKVRPRVSPESIKARIEDALRRSAEVDAGRVSVEVDGTTVILRGTVRSWAEKQDAERAAWSAPGVTTVANMIAVEP
jgi:osmotically-inducible protein OsmY